LGLEHYGILRALHRIWRLDSFFIHVAELRQLLDLEGEVSSAQRLGYIVEKLGCEKLARTIHAWLPEPLPWVPLSGAQGDGRSDADRIPRWHVFGETSV
jgi:hypothetical protein